MAEFNATDDARYEAAADWYTRLATTASEADWLAFASWLEADPLNRDAFDVVSETAAEIETHKSALAAVAPSETKNIVSLADVHGIGHRPRHGFIKSRPRRLWAAGLVAIAASLLLAIFVQRPQLGQPALHTWTTGVGEHKTVKLEDGSQIQLNTDTTVSVTYAPDMRQAHLEKGEAHFDVASDAHRPFSVAVGDRRVDVIGTAFDILRADGKLTVTVARGIVRVAPRVGPAADETRVKLMVGDQYRAQEGQTQFDVVKVDPATALAWRSGRLIFDDAPLSQVIADLNRYYPRKFTIADTATEEIRFSGVLKLDDEVTMTKHLEGLLPITVQSQGNDLVLKRRSPD